MMKLSPFRSAVMKNAKCEPWSVDVQNDQFPILWNEAKSIWDRCENELGFGAYVPADYALVLKSLRRLQGRVDTFLEWGSGLGVVTIMASRLGFDSYGLELAPELIVHAEELAQKFGPSAKFAQGSFVPEAYDWDPQLDIDGSRTDFDAPDGYEAMDMELSDFDVVYVYPWPHEHDIFTDILRKHGRNGGLMLSYDVREGMKLKRLLRSKR